MPHKPGIGAIFGITSEDGVAAQKRVVLMDRSTLTIVARTVANADGGYVFNGLDPDTNDYLVFAVDDDGTLPKEAIIHDYIRPIPAYQGATFPGNWEKRAFSDGAVSGFFGLLDQNGSPIEMSGWASYFEGNTVTYAQPSLTPGAPHLPATQLTSCAIGVAAKPGYGGLYGTPQRISIEWVFKRSSVNSGRQAGVGAFLADASAAYQLSSDTSYIVMIGALRYSHAAQTLYAYNQTASTYPGAWGGWRTLVNGFSLASYSDVVHIVFTMEYANEAVLYVNGTPVTTVSLAGQNTSNYRTDDDANCIGACIFGDIADSGTNKPLGRYTTLLTGPFVVYDRILSAQNVLDHYKDLMIGTSPAETGYAKEVLLDHPMYYYRLGEADATNGFADWLTQASGTRHALTVYNAAGISLSQSSPVAGRTAVRFNGTGAARGNTVCGNSSSRRELTFEFFIEPTTQPPTANEIICYNTSDAEAVYAGVYRDTNSRLCLQTRESAAIVTLTFATVLAANVRRHIAITLNKGAQRARLYINGALVETLAATATLTDQWHFNAHIYRETMIGGLVNDAFNGLTYPLRAYLSEVAFYSYELAPSRIQAHYDARNIV